MAWVIGAKSASVSINTDITGEIGLLWKNTSYMKRAIGPLMAWSRNAVPNAKSGKTKFSLAKILRAKTDWGLIAKTACGQIHESVTRKRGRAWNNIIDMRSAIELLTGWNKNDVADAKGGRPRTNITNITDVKTDCLWGARYVQIKLPTKHVRND